MGTLARPFLGVLFLIVLLFIRPQDDRPNMADLHYPAVIMIAVMVATFARPAQLQQRLTAVASCLAPFAAILGLMWLSGLANGYGADSSYEIGQFFTTILFCAFLVIWVDSEKRLIFTVATLLLCGAYYVRTVFSDPRMIREEIAGQQFDRVFLRHLVNFGNPNYLALLMTLLIFLALSMFAVKYMGWKKVAIVPALLGYVYVFLKCQSRGATVSLVLGFMVFWMLQKRKAVMAAVTIFTVAIGLAFFTPSTFFARLSTVASYEEDSSAMDRLEFWNISINLIRSHPVLGIGPANFMNYATNSQHESYLEIGSETGLLGLFLYVGCLIRGLVLALSARTLASPGRKNLPVLFSFAGGLATCVVVLIIEGFFTGFSYREFVYTVLTLAFLVKDLAVRAEAQAPEVVTYVQTFPRAISHAYETPRQA